MALSQNGPPTSRAERMSVSISAAAIRAESQLLAAIASQRTAAAEAVAREASDRADEAENKLDTPPSPVALPPRPKPDEPDDSDVHGGVVGPGF